MANSVDFLCKTSGKSLFKNCLKNSGKNLNLQNLVEKISFSHSFSKVFNNELNRPFILIKVGYPHFPHSL